MLRALYLPLLLCLLLLSVPPAAARDQAGGTPPVDRLYTALAMPDIVEIMHLEGLDYAAELSVDLLGSPRHEAWSRSVAKIYETPLLEQVVRDRLAAELEGADIEPMVTFFESPLGAEIIGLELAARSAMLAPEVDATARAALADLRETDPARLGLLQSFSDVNDLVEYNVVGAMNSNYAFYRGLNEGGGFGEPFTDEEILADVWSQEAEIRAETEEWLMAYLALAYQPLTDEELAAYVAFSETSEGQDLNRAIFAAFDEMYITVSLALGTAAAEFMAGQDL